VVPALAPLALKPAPVALTLEMVAFVFLLFVRATLSELVVPSFTFPKFKRVGLAPSSRLTLGRSSGGPNPTSQTSHASRDPRGVASFRTRAVRILASSNHLLSSRLFILFLFQLSRLFPPGEHCVTRNITSLLRGKSCGSNFPPFGTAHFPQSNSVRVLLFAHIS
jgi:hypothetical protein